MAWDSLTPMRHLDIFARVCATILILLVVLSLRAYVGSTTTGKVEKIENLPKFSKELQTLQPASDIRFAYFWNHRDHSFVISNFVDPDELNTFAESNKLMIFPNQEKPSPVLTVLNRMDIKGSGIETNFNKGDPQLMGVIASLGFVEARYNRSTHAFTLLASGRH